MSASSSARDQAFRLFELLCEIRATKPDERDFALFDRRDAFAALGAPFEIIDAFDA